MAIGDDKPGPKPPQDSREGGPRDGVRHDSRGNAVWQWAVDTGKQAIDSTSRLLKRLEVPGLSLEDDATKPGAKRAADPAAGAARGTAKPERATGYDPYGTRAGAKRPAARPAVRPGARPAAAVRTPAAAPPARPSFWRRLFRRG